MGCGASGGRAVDEEAVSPKAEAPPSAPVQAAGDDASTKDGAAGEKAGTEKPGAVKKTNPSTQKSATSETKTQGKEAGGKGNEEEEEEATQKPKPVPQVRKPAPTESATMPEVKKEEAGSAPPTKETKKMADGKLEPKPKPASSEETKEKVKEIENESKCKQQPQDKAAVATPSKAEESPNANDKSSKQGPEPRKSEEPEKTNNKKEEEKRAQPSPIQSQKSASSESKEAKPPPTLRKSSNLQPLSLKSRGKLPPLPLGLAAALGKKPSPFEAYMDADGETKLTLETEKIVAPIKADKVDVTNYTIDTETIDAFLKDVQDASQEGQIALLDFSKTLRKWRKPVDGKSPTKPRLHPLEAFSDLDEGFTGTIDSAAFAEAFKSGSIDKVYCGLTNANMDKFLGELATLSEAGKISLAKFVPHLKQWKKANKRPRGGGMAAILSARLTRLSARS
uniref:EF-hand domain-containing protein n=1 Tax=Lotharella globosa TaxID=91324 RepID=A0A7S4DS98_9EUKA|mmetsp:Transcript_4924/g.9670  ORF Transcript_4924/g.9670 Transcript_4924/m.9670 type:complete len:451 (-) Transcript_4924:269-1621(-)